MPLRAALRCLPTLLLSCLYISVLLPPHRASAQALNPRNLDGTRYGESIDLTLAWLFSPTDNPAYALPDFDDTHWTAISTSTPLLAYGFRNFPLCWYRLHVQVRPEARDLLVGADRISGAYEVFVNGVRLGGKGKVSPIIKRDQYAHLTFPIPNSLISASGGSLVIALRFAPETAGDTGKGTSSPIGAGSAILLESPRAAQREAGYLFAHQTAAFLASAALSLVVAFVALALYLALGTEQEYLAIGFYLLLQSLRSLLLISTRFDVLTLSDSIVFEALSGGCNIAVIEFVRLVLGLPRSRIFVAIELACFFSEFGGALATAGGPFLLAFLSHYLPLLLVTVFLPILLLRGLLRGHEDARVLLPALFIFFLADYWNFLTYAAFLLHLTPMLVRTIFHIGTYTVSYLALGDLAFYFFILLFLVLRTVRISRDRARVTTEIEAAQSMQRLLLARASEPTPGFHVESVYLPAGEVGGDFFLVSPNPHDGSLTAIVGDVSGKGLTAAMRVAMILGILRRENSREPAIILHRLNHALLTQGDVGFTTACCVRLQPGGAFTIANAGHISPYIDGVEIETSPGLPLGLARPVLAQPALAHPAPAEPAIAESSSDPETQAYPQLAGKLPDGTRMVLMSDGVVEARSKTGELYGFDRLGPLTLQTAHDIAATAQAFGQEDDITVLTLACTT